MIALRSMIFAAGAAAGACGTPSAPVLERVEPAMPPAVTHRLEVFLVSRVSACVIGRACASSDTSSCFYVRSSSGVTYFEPQGMEFVAPDDPRIANAARSACFQLELDQSNQDSATQSFSALRSSVYQLSQGAIDLDLRVHVVTPERGDFKRWEGGSGLFLQPSTLESVALPQMSPDSDFVFAITGEADESMGTLPKIDPCGGTNWQAQGGLGGTAYTWLSRSCISTAALRWHLFYQAYFALRDVVGFDDLYRDAYPPCGQTAADPKRWFPRPSDCGQDPDSLSCGRANCDEMAFAAHILTAHWPTKPGLIGNHCRNGRMDFDETMPDAGGVCEQLGR